MLRSLGLVVGGLLVVGQCVAQPLAFSTPRQVGLAGMAVPLPDGMAALLSPAAMGEMDVAELSVAGGRLYGLAGLPVLSAGVAGPVWGAHKAGAGVVRLGSGSMTQTFAAGAYAYRLDKTTLAVQAGYFQMAIGDAPPAGVPVVTLSGQTKLIPRLTLAGMVQNVTQPRLSPETGERLSATFRASGVFEAGERLWLAAQVDKQLGRETGLAAGLEYRVHRYVRLRAGAAPLPGYVAGGFRLDVWGAQLEYGLAWHGLLGAVHSVGLGWSFVQKEQTRPAEMPVQQ